MNQKPTSKMDFVKYSRLQKWILLIKFRREMDLGNILVKKQNELETNSILIKSTQEMKINIIINIIDPSFQATNRFYSEWK